MVNCKLSFVEFKLGSWQQRVGVMPLMSAKHIAGGNKISAVQRRCERGT